MTHVVLDVIYQNKWIRSHYCSSFIPLKHYYSWEWSPTTLTHQSHLGTRLKNSVTYKSRSCTRNTTHKQPCPPPHYCARGHCNATDEFRIKAQRIVDFPCLVRPRCAWPTDAIVNMNVRSNVFELCASFSDMLHCHYTTTIHFD